MADIEQQRAAFEAAMVAAGYDKPERPRGCVVTGDYLWQRDQDRFVGFQLALASQAQVPDVYVLVPREPTDAMLEAAHAADTTRAPNLSRWRAMIAAAPAPEAGSHG